jgi:hypothetical protein
MAGNADTPNVYPYRPDPLKVGWTSPRARAWAVVSPVAALVATWIEGPFALATLNSWALHIAFPALLAAVLAAAPRPSTRVGRIAKEMTLAATLVALFGGRWVPVMLACFPVVLAASVALGELGIGTRVWEAGDGDDPDGR